MLIRIDVKFYRRCEELLACCCNVFRKREIPKLINALSHLKLPL